jgi:hypothetical protein
MMEVKSPLQLELEAEELSSRAQQLARLAGLKRNEARRMQSHKTAAVIYVSGDNKGDGPNGSYYHSDVPVGAKAGDVVHVHNSRRGRVRAVVLNV